MSKEIKRMRYFNGLLLKEEDLNLEQNYNMRLHRLHNRYFHDWGIMDGLEVEAVVGAPQVKVSQGMALNRVFVEETKEELSQEILICENHPDNPVDLSAYNQGDNIYITVCYEEIPADLDRQKGGHEIHVWERARIKHGPEMPEDPRQEIILARVRLDVDESGNKIIREISDTDIDGETKLRTYAVLRGQALEVDKLSVGPKDKLNLPYLTGLNDPQVGAGDGIDIHSPFTRFTGSVISSSIKTLGNADINGALTVTTNNKQALKVNPTGTVDIMGPANVADKLSVTGGLNVKGSNTTIDTPQVVVTSNIIKINQYTPKENETEPIGHNSGIKVYRGETAPEVQLVWDEGDKVWKAGMEENPDIPGSGMYAIAYGTDWDKMHKGIYNVDNLHKHSQICSSDGIAVLSAGTSGNVDINKALVATEGVISKSGSFEATRPGTLKNAKLLWNETDKHWQVNIEDKVYNILYGDDWNELTSGVNVDSLHIHSQLFNADGNAMAVRVNPVGDVDIPLDLTVGENLTVVGNLNVLGTTTTVNTVKLEVTDNVVVVNKCAEGTQPIAEGGLEVYRGGTLPNARIIWDEGSDHWKIGTGSSMVEMPYGSQWEELTHGAVTENMHKHGHLYTQAGYAALGVDADGNTIAEEDVIVNGGLTVENDAQINGQLEVGGSLTIVGDLTVNGTTTTVNTATLEVDDNVIIVNKYTGQDTPFEGHSGLEVYRGGEEPNARMVWDEAEGKWKAGLGDNIVDLAYGPEWDTLTSGTSADSLHKHGELHRADGNTALSVNTEGKVGMHGDAEVAGAFSVGGSMTVEGNLLVKGTTVQQTDTEITDNVIVLNRYTGEAPPVSQSGVEIYRGESNPKARFVWDENLMQWRMGIGGELHEIAGGSSWSMLTSRDNADTLHNHSQIYNEKGDMLALSASAAGNVNVANSMAIEQNLKVLGNFDVRGGLTTINTPIFETRSNSLVVNRYEPGTLPLKTTSGLEVYRGLGTENAVVIWDEDNDRWKIASSTKSPGLIVNSDGSIAASGSMQADKAIISKDVQAGSANIQGSLTVKTGMEVPFGTGQKAYVMWNDIANQWKIGAGSGKDVFVTDKGEIGIGTGAPKAALDVNGDAIVSGSITAANATLNGNLTVNDSIKVNGSLVLGNGLEVNRGTALKKAQIMWSESDKKWLFGVEGDMKEIMLMNHKHNDFYNSDGTIMALSADIKGNIGIGTTTPKFKLDVYGDASINGKLMIKTGLEIARGAKLNAMIYWDDVAEKWLAGTSGNLKDISLSGHRHQNLHGADGAAIVNVDSSGNVGIGRTVADNAKLDVNGNIKAQNINANSELNGFSVNVTTANIKGDLNAASAVVSGNISAANATISNDLTIAGNLTVNGNTVTVNATTLEVEDSIVTVNKYAPQAEPANVNGGLEVFRGGSAENANAQLIWDEAVDKWKAGTVGSLKELSYSDHKHSDVWTPDGAAAVISITSDSKVGIGTTTPDAKLDVEGDASINGNLNAASATIVDTLSTANANVNSTLIATNVNVSDAITTNNAKINGSLNAVGATLSGNLDAASAVISGSLSAASAALGNADVSGDLKAANANISGTISAEKATLSGNLDAASAVISGSLSAASAALGNADVSGDLKAANANIDGNISAAKAIVSGNLTAAGAAITGTISSAIANVSDTLTTNNAKVNGSLSAIGATFNGNVSAASANITNDLTVGGNLTVNGSMVTVNTTTLEVKDSIVTVNKYANQDTPLNVNGGLEVFRGGSAANANAQLIWDEAADKWKAGTAGNLKELSYSDHKHSNVWTPDGAAAVMSISSDAKVGIGTTTPVAKLDVQGDAAVSGNLNAAGAAITGTISAAIANVSDTLTTINANVNGTITTNNAKVNGSLNAVGATLSGNLDAASATLDSADVSGSLSAANVTVNSTLTTANAVINGNVNAASATLNGSLSAADATINNTLSTLNANITGSLDAGNTTLGNTVVKGSLTVANGIDVNRGDLGSNAQVIWDETTGKWQAGTKDSLKEISLSDHQHGSLCTTDGTTAISLDEKGNVGIGKAPDSNYMLDVNGLLRVVELVQTSSQTFKENIEQLNDKTALDLLTKLNPVSFDFKANSSKKHNIGFIAEEVPDVFATPDHKAVALMDIIGVLTSVVKLQQKETASMKKQMTALQKQVASLKA